VGLTREVGCDTPMGYVLEVFVALGEQAFYSCGRSLNNVNNHCQINGILTEINGILTEINGIF